MDFGIEGSDPVASCLFSSCDCFPRISQRWVKLLWRSLVQIIPRLCFALATYFFISDFPFFDEIRYFFPGPWILFSQLVLFSISLLVAVPAILGAGLMASLMSRQISFFLVFSSSFLMGIGFWFLTWPQSISNYYPLSSRVSWIISASICLPFGICAGTFEGAYSVILGRIQADTACVRILVEAAGFSCDTIEVHPHTSIEFHSPLRNGELSKEITNNGNQDHEIKSCCGRVKHACHSDNVAALVAAVLGVFFLLIVSDYVLRKAESNENYDLYYCGIATLELTLFSIILTFSIASICLVGNDHPEHLNNFHLIKIFDELKNSFLSSNPEINYIEESNPSEFKEALRGLPSKIWKNRPLLIYLLFDSFFISSSYVFLLLWFPFNMRTDRYSLPHRSTPIFALAASTIISVLLCPFIHLLCGLCRKTLLVIYTVAFAALYIILSVSVTIPNWLFLSICVLLGFVYGGYLESSEVVKNQLFDYCHLINSLREDFLYIGILKAGPKLAFFVFGIPILAWIFWFSDEKRERGITIVGCTHSAFIILSAFLFYNKYPIDRKNYQKIYRALCRRYCGISDQDPLQPGSVLSPLDHNKAIELIQHSGLESTDEIDELQSIAYRQAISKSDEKETKLQVPLSELIDAPVVILSRPLPKFVPTLRRYHALEIHHCLVYVDGKIFIEPRPEERFYRRSSSLTGKDDRPPFLKHYPKYLCKFQPKSGSYSIKDQEMVYKLVRAQILTISTPRSVWRNWQTDLCPVPEEKSEEVESEASEAILKGRMSKSFYNKESSDDSSHSSDDSLSAWSQENKVALPPNNNISKHFLPEPPPISQKPYFYHNPLFKVNHTHFSRIYQLAEAHRSSSKHSLKNSWDEADMKISQGSKTPQSRQGSFENFEFINKSSQDLDSESSSSLSLDSNGLDNESSSS
eukprot:GHVP01014034.1.p1 GENE.GHVP01014034.1~~GHVP01014034.1.p1  ORF type:complete len:921 (-),score=115.93 GHVP01014034.1:1478-4240(-)